MANETSLPLISQYIDPIWEAALHYAQVNFIMPSLVRTYADRGWARREVTEYSAGTVTENLAETQDLTPQQLIRNLLSVLTPAEHGMQYIVTDRRLETDTENVLADAAMEIGSAIGKHMELKLMGDFANLTGGSVGSAGSSLTWTNIYEGRARLSTAGVPGPYNVVLSEWQYLDLATVANIAALHSSTQGAAAPLTVRNDIQNRYYIGSQGDMNFYVSGNVPVDGSDDATGAIFHRDALALDMRRGLRIEPQRDASLRSTELNASIVYAHGIWRPSWGVKIVSDSLAAGTSVSQSSIVNIFGTVDDTTLSVGQDAVFTFVVSNAGTVVSTGISVAFTIAANYTYLSDSVSQGSYNSGSAVWTVGALAPGDSARITLTLDATTSGASKTVVGAVTATPTNSGANTSATVTATIS